MKNFECTVNGKKALVLGLNLSMAKDKAKTLFKGQDCTFTGSYLYLNGNGFYKWAK